MKKFLSWLLAFAIIAEVFSGTFISVQAEETSNDIAEAEEYIYYTDLFYAYPYYLANDEYFQSYSAALETIYDSVHAAYQNSSLKVATGFGAALDTITSPSDMITLITDTLGLTDFSYNNALDAANEELVRNLLSDSWVYSVDNAFGETAKWNKKINSLVSFFNKLNLESSSGNITYSAEYYVQKAFDYLQDEGYISFVSDETLAELWVEINASDFALSDCFELASTEIEIAEALVTGIMMEDTRLAIVDEIIATQGSDTILRQGMYRLKSKLQGNFITHFIENYLCNKIADEMFDVIDGFIVDTVTGKELSALLKIAKKVFNKVVEYPDIKCVLKWQVLMCYSKDLANGIPELALSFAEGPFYSDEIIKYENMFIAYDAINKAALNATNSVERMLDPYGKAYALLNESVENNIDTILIESGQNKVPISSTITEAELYSILITGTIVVDETSGEEVRLEKEIKMSNGMTTINVFTTASVMTLIMQESIRESEQAIKYFEDNYADVSLYGEHIHSVKKKIVGSPAEERNIVSADIYTGWTYELVAGTKLHLQSDTVEAGCIYAFNGMILGNANIINYVVPSGLDIGIAGNAVVGCWDSFTISESAHFVVGGDFKGNAWAYADAYRSTIANNGCLEVRGTLYGYGNYSGKGEYVLNDVTASSINFKNATYRIKGNTQNSITYESARVIIEGTETQTVNLNGTLLSLDVYSTKLTLNPSVTITEYIDFHGKNVTVSDYINIASSAKVKEGSNYKKLYFPDRYTLTNNISAYSLYFRGGLDVNSGNHTLTGTVDFWYGDNFVRIKKGASLKIAGHAVGREWAWQPIRTTVVNDGEMTVIGTLYYRWNLRGAGVYNLKNIYSTDACIKLENASFNISGSVTNGQVVISNVAGIDICGKSKQTLNFTGAISQLRISNTVGTTFNSTINVTSLFDHQGNPFVLYNSGYGSGFVDYDGDGMKDNVDPEPTVGKLCTVNFGSNNDTYGTVSENAISTYGGTVVSVTATPTFKYRFVKWINASGSTVGTSETYTFKVTKDMTYTAVFEKRTQNITTESTGGTISAPSKATIESEVQVSVVEDEGYVYAENSLKYNGVIVKNGSFIMPDESVTLTAEFVRNDNYFLLKEKITEAESYSYENYSASSYTNLISAIEKAKTFLYNNVSKVDVEEQISELQDTIDLLTSKYVVDIAINEEVKVFVGYLETLLDTTVTVTYDNGTTATITIADCEMGEYNCNQLGEQDIIITYEGKECLVETIVTEIPEVAITGIRRWTTSSNFWYFFLNTSEPLSENGGIRYEQDEIMFENVVTNTKEAGNIRSIIGSANLLRLTIETAYLPIAEEMVEGEYIIIIPAGTILYNADNVVKIAEEFKMVYAGDSSWKIKCDTHTVSENYVVDVEPTTTTNGSISYLCEKCGDAVSTKELPYLKISGASLTLQNNLAIKYRVAKTLIDENEYENPYVVFSLNGRTITVTNYTEDDECYLFEFRNIAPNQINDTIQATLYATFNGTEYASETVEYSVATYCYNMLSKYTTDEYAELRTLLVDLLNYGAEAQKYTEYNIDNLANASLTEEQMAWGTSEAPVLNTVLNTKHAEVETPTVKWKSAILNLNDSITIQLKLETEDISGLRVEITDKDQNVLANISESHLIATDGGYHVNYKGLHAGQMSEEIYITAYRNDVATSNTVCYSIESYAYAKQNSDYLNLGDLVVAMMKYGNSARKYVN